MAGFLVLPLTPLPYFLGFFFGDIGAAAVIIDDVEAGYVVHVLEAAFHW